MKRFKRYRVLFLAAWVTACAHYRLNEQLARYDDKAGYRFDRFTAAANNTDSLFVCLAFSGGGTRAAAFSYGVLKKLAEVKIEWQGKQKNLLDEVDCISSVSGGSFTAAYYALFPIESLRTFRNNFYTEISRASCFPSCSTRSIWAASCLLISAASIWPPSFTIRSSTKKLSAIFWLPSGAPL